MKNRILIFSCILILANAYAFASGEKAVVGLYADRESGTKGGTGFFVTKNGHILTAYHVVYKSKSIKAIDANGYAYNNLIVEFIAPNRDLALLHVNEEINVPFYLPMVDRCPTVNENLVIIGYPRGMPNQVISAKTSYNSFLSSHTFRTAKGKRLFSQNVDLVPVVIPAVYYGMSGAPVIANGQVVGVFSGSLNEGGAISWAIPCKYYHDLYKFGKRASEISQWPPLTLMSDNFNDLNRSYKVDLQGERYLEDYLTSVSEYSKVTAQIPELSYRVVTAMMISRPMLTEALSNNELLGNKKALLTYIEYPMSQLFKSLEGIDKIMKHKVQWGFAANNKYYQLKDYIDNLQITQKQKNDYLQHLNSLRPKLVAVVSFQDELKILDNRSAQILPNFAMGMSQLDGPYSITKARQFIRSILSLYDDFGPIAEAYSSQQFINNFTKEVSLFRSMGAAYENVIFY